MGLFDFISDTLFGTEGDAQAKNEANVKQALAHILGVPVGQISDQAIAQITGAPEQSIRKGYGQAIAQVGAAGTGASLDALSAGKAQKGAARSQLMQRGLFGSSLLTGAESGIQEGTNRTIADIMGQTAGAQAGLFAGEGTALAGETRSRQALLAQLYGLKADRMMGQAGQAANILGNVQHQGTPGLFGPMLGAFAGGFGGAAGKFGSKLGGKLLGV